MSDTVEVTCNCGKRRKANINKEPKGYIKTVVFNCGCEIDIKFTATGFEYI